MQLLEIIGIFAVGLAIVPAYQTIRSAMRFRIRSERPLRLNSWRDSFVFALTCNHIGHKEKYVSVEIGFGDTVEIRNCLRCHDVA